MSRTESSAERGQIFTIYGYNKSFKYNPIRLFQKHFNLKRRWAIFKARSIKEKFGIIIKYILGLLILLIFLLQFEWIYIYFNGENDETENKMLVSCFLVGIVLPLILILFLLCKENKKEENIFDSVQFKLVSIILVQLTLYVICCFFLGFFGIGLFSDFFEKILEHPSIVRVIQELESKTDQENDNV